MSAGMWEGAVTSSACRERCSDENSEKYLVCIFKSSPKSHTLGPFQEFGIRRGRKDYGVRVKYIMVIF